MFKEQNREIMRDCLSQISKIQGFQQKFDELSKQITQLSQSPSPRQNDILAQKEREFYNSE
jgi:hypothetical protein